MLHMFLCTSRMRFTRSWTTFVDLRTKCVTAVQQCLFGTVLWHENNKIRLREMCLRGPSDVCPLISLVRSQKNGHRFGEANFADPGEISNELHDDQPPANSASTGCTLFLNVSRSVEQKVGPSGAAEGPSCILFTLYLFTRSLTWLVHRSMSATHILCLCQIHSTTRK